MSGIAVRLVVGGERDKESRKQTAESRSYQSSGGRVRGQELQAAGPREKARERGVTKGP
jgi:hypothetical protein